MAYIKIYTNELELLKYTICREIHNLQRICKYLKHTPTHCNNINILKYFKYTQYILHIVIIEKINCERMRMKIFSKEEKKLFYFHIILLLQI